MTNHKKINIASVFFCVVFMFSNSYAQENLLNYDNSAKYASYLFDNQVYDLSAMEYERVVYLNPADTLAKLRLVQSYRLMNELEIAKTKLDGFFPCCIKCCHREFARENLKILFLQHRYNECLNFLSESATLDSVSVAEFKTAVLLKQNRWKEANMLSESFLQNNNPTTIMTNLRDISRNGLNIKYKSPVLSATLSSVIPGTGKIYTGQWRDGIYSFLAVSAFSYLTYRSFYKNGLNPYGFVFGTFAFTFYTANVFGSYKSAKRYNQNQNRRVLSEVDSLITESPTHSHL